MSSFIVIGAGVNGLAAALELSRNGHKVVLVEARNEVGGLSARRTFGNGFEVSGVRHDTCEIRPALVDSLGLGSQGLKLQSDYLPILATDEKDGFVLHRSPEAAADEIGKRSQKDAAAYRAFRTLMTNLRPVLAPLVDKPPPPLLPSRFGEMFEMGMMGLKLRGLGQRDMTEVMRAAPMCVADWMREQFETEILSATLSFPAVIGDYVGPWSPGTAAFLILRESMSVPGVVGGPAAVADALVAALKSGSTEVRTGARVARILIEGGRAKGVALDSGEQIAADAVIATNSAKTALTTMLPPLSLDTKDHLAARTIRTRGTASKVHLGLREPVKWKARAGEFTHVRVGGAHLDDLERSFDAAKYGELPEKPALDIVVGGSASRPTLSVMVMGTPFDLKEGWSAGTKQKLLDTVVGMLEAAASGVRSSIEASEVISPVDLENDFGAVGGSLHHVERALDQMVLMRPARPFARFATPIEGYFVGGSGCHPGPGVTLAAGVLAARAALGK